MSSTATIMLSLPVSGRDHVQGRPVAPITLVEYGDYECPRCGEAHSILKELQKRLGYQLRFVFRHFPITTVHAHAEHAAEAAEATGAQGRFWEMHDTLFTNQGALSDKHLKAYAKQKGLDLTQFNLEMIAHAHVVRVREDFLSGVRSGVDGTPTFFINDIRHDGPYELDSLSAAIIDAMPPDRTGS
jgi:protein-disulfide isomerase